MKSSGDKKRKYLLIIAVAAVVLLPFFVLGNATINSPQSNRLTSGLVGYWNFDGNNLSGTTVTDVSASGNNGTITTSEPVKDPSPSIGTTGQALEFFGDLDGDSFGDYVDLDDPSELSISGNMTVSLWAKFDVSQSNIPLFARWGSDQSYGMFISASNPNKIAFTIRVSESNEAAGSSNTYNDGQWHHFVGRFDGSNVLLTVDGGAENITGDATSGPIDTPVQEVRMGTYGNGSSPYEGSIDEVRVYNRSLSDEEVVELYNLGRAEINSPPNNRSTSGLVGYWSFNGPDLTTTTSTDVSVNSNDGTLNGNPIPSIGAIGQGLYFDGDGDYVDLGSPSELDFSATSSPFSISVWIKPTDTGVSGAGGIIKRGSAFVGAKAFDKFSVTFNAFFREADFALGDGSSNENILLDDIDLEEWNHLVFVYGNDGVLRGYKNAVEGSDTQTITLTGAASDNGTYIGAHNVNQSYFDGTIDEVRVYGHALSVDEILELYRLGIAEINTPQNNRLTSGLTGMWSFNGPDLTTTTSTDVSVNSNDGTLGGSPAPTIGVIGQALEFDGSDDYVDLSNDSTFCSLSEGTVAGWIYVNDFSDTRPLFSVSDIATAQHFSPFFANSSQKIGFGIQQNAGSWELLVNSDDTVSANTWYHIAITVNSSGNALYIDGNQANVTYTNGDANTSLFYDDISGCDEANVGFTNLDGTASDDYFDGKIDEVRVYSKALSADEVLKLYRMGR